MTLSMASRCHLGTRRSGVAGRRDGWPRLPSSGFWRLFARPLGSSRSAAVYLAREVARTLSWGARAISLAEVLLEADGPAALLRGRWAPKTGLGWASEYGEGLAHRNQSSEPAGRVPPFHLANHRYVESLLEAASSQRPQEHATKAVAASTAMGEGPGQGSAGERVGMAALPRCRSNLRSNLPEEPHGPPPLCHLLRRSISILTQGLRCLQAEIDHYNVSIAGSRPAATPARNGTGTGASSRSQTGGGSAVAEDVQSLRARPFFESLFPSSQGGVHKAVPRYPELPHARRVRTARWRKERRRRSQPAQASRGPL